MMTKLSAVGFFIFILVVFAAAAGYGQVPGYGPGYGMGPYGAMHPGMGNYCFQPGMGGPEYQPGFGGWQGARNKACGKFLDETSALRKEFNFKRFDYMEALRSADTKPEDLTRMAKELRDLLEKIHAKNPINCWW
jgi:hypothetical protein